MLIVYSSADEVLTCTPEVEPYLLRVWFTEGGRDLEDYDRDTLEGPEAVLEVNTRLYIG
jgi:hypothetical protein